jgi:hypothetical protein
MINQEINLFLTDPQERFVFSKARHPGMCAGYGAGKSEAAVIRILMQAIKYPGLDFGFVEPTFDLVRLIAWPRFEMKLQEWGISYNLNKTDQIIWIPSNRNKIIFRSADNSNRLVGFEVADAVIDEADVLPHQEAANVWVKMIGRARQVKPDGEHNTVAAVSTPEGFKWMYETFEKNKREGYELVRAPTYSNPYLPAGYVESLKATYSSSLLEAYLEGNFVNLNSGSVYPEFDRVLNSCRTTIDRGLGASWGRQEHLHIGMDFNVNNMSAAVAVLREGDPHFVDEIVQVRDTPSMIEVIRSRYRGHPITVYPDASGGNVKSVNASFSDITMLRAAGFTVLAPRSNPFVKDRVLSVNQMILNKDIRRLKINPDKCPTIVEGLEQQAYNKSGEPDKSGNQDHINDAVGYFISYKFGIARGPMRLVSVMGA